MVSRLCLPARPSPFVYSSFVRNLLRIIRGGAGLVVPGMQMERNVVTASYLARAEPAGTSQGPTYDCGQAVGVDRLGDEPARVGHRECGTKLLTRTAGYVNHGYSELLLDSERGKYSGFVAAKIDVREHEDRSVILAHE